MLKKLNPLNKAIETAQEKIQTLLASTLGNLANSKVSDIKDDATYQTLIINPAYMALSGSLGGVDKFIPTIKEKFTAILMDVRDELVVIEGNSLSLQEDAQQRLPKIIQANLKA